MVLPWPNTDMSDQDERTAELEAKVERLEATVQGLTEELVEVHDRLETLESGASADPGSEKAAGHGRDTDATPDESRSASTRPEHDGGSDEAKTDETQKEDETGGDSDAGDDIIVA